MSPLPAALQSIPIQVRQAPLPGRYLIAIDPGFDSLVAVVVDLDRHERLAKGKPANQLDPSVMLAFERTTKFTSEPNAPLDARAAKLVDGLRALVRAYPPRAAVVELPPTLVPYGKRTGRSMGQLGMAIGLTLATLRALEVYTSCMAPDRAPGKPAGGVKKWRRDQVHRLCKAVGATCERNQDVIDAQWLGCRALLDGRWRT